MISGGSLKNNYENLSEILQVKLSLRDKTPILLRVVPPFPPVSKNLKGTKLYVPAYGFGR